MNCDHSLRGVRILPSSFLVSHLHFLLCPVHWKVLKGTDNYLSSSTEVFAPSIQCTVYFRYSCFPYYTLEKGSVCTDKQLKIRLVLQRSPLRFSTLTQMALSLFRTLLGSLLWVSPSQEN